MDASHGSSNPVEQYTKQPVGRRVWSRPEEEALIVGLKDLIEKGWKSDNAFRAGYLNQLEIALNKKFPHAKLTGVKHINSKMTVWKKVYGQVSSMLNTSGFGWDDETHQVKVNDDVWADYARVHPDVAKMRNRAYPFFDDWVEIFGKDRATGEHARTAHDAILQLLHPHRVEEGVQANGKGKAKVVPDDNCYIPHGPNGETVGGVNIDSEEEVTQQSQQKTTDKEKGSGRNKYIKRRKKTSTVVPDPYVELLGSFFEATRATMESIASRIGAAREGTSSKTDLVYDQIEEMAFIAPEARLFLCQKILSNQIHTDLFLKMKGERQVSFVTMMLDGKIP